MFLLGGFQIASHLANYKADGVLEAIRSKAYVQGNIIPIITPNDDGSGDTLKICDGIPQSDTDQTCVPIVDAPPDDQPPKPKQDQGAATTAVRDVFSYLSDALYTPRPYPTDETRYYSATALGKLASAVANGAARATDIANQPLVSGTAVRLSEVSPPVFANGKRVYLLAAVSRDDKAI